MRPLRTISHLCIAALACVMIAACGPDGARPQAQNFVNIVTPAKPLSPEGGRAYTQINPAEFEEGPIKIAILLPLSGPSAATGKALLDAAGLALFEAYDPRIQLLPFDTLGSSAGAARAANSAVEADVVLMLGPLFSEATESAAAIARRADVPMIAFTNNMSLAGNGVYLLSFSPDEEVRSIVHYAARQGHTHFAGLIPEGPYGDIVLRSLSRAISETGGTLTALELYPQNADEMFGPVRRLANYDQRRQAWVDETRFLDSLGGDMAEEILEPLEPLEAIGEVDFDAVIIPEGGELLRSLAPLLPFFEVDPAKIQFMGTGLWDDRSLIHEPPLRGGIYASASPEVTDRFVNRFRNIYGYAPPRIATLAYDAMALSTYLAREQLKQRRFSQTALTNPVGFSGIDGPFRFHLSGRVERALAIVQISSDAVRTIEPAPNGFSGRPQS